MGKSVPIFNKILETNRLIKGRLKVRDSDLKKIYIDLYKHDERLTKREFKEEEKIKSHLEKRNNIKIERKRISETIEKSFFPASNKVSLLYKKQRNANYIKARFYWRSKQREVQVGSVPIVINIINNMIFHNMLDNKTLKNLTYHNEEDISWDNIIKYPEIVDAIKTIAAFKAQEYILKRLLSNKQDVIRNAKENGDIVIIEENIPEETNSIIDNKSIDKEIDSAEKIEESIPEETNSIIDKKSIDKEIDSVEKIEEDIVEEDLKGVRWYENWREENL